MEMDLVLQTEMSLVQLTEKDSEHLTETQLEILKEMHLVCSSAVLMAMQMVQLKELL